MAPTATDAPAASAAAATKANAGATEIPDDEAEVYDRQIRLWGVDAQRRIQGTKILVLGMLGVNVEVCKNLVLAGMSVDVQDGQVATDADLASNFFLAAAATATNNACMGTNVSDEATKK
jgi:ubiquitin-like 1-activating enzyme E1 A